MFCYTFQIQKTTNFVIMIIFFLQCFDLSLLHVMFHCLKKYICLNIRLMTSNDLT